VKASNIDIYCADYNRKFGYSRHKRYPKWIEFRIMAIYARLIYGDAEYIREDLVSLDGIYSES